MVFMNARKQNKTIIMVMVGVISVGLLLSVSLYFTGGTNYSTNASTGTQVTGGTPEQEAVQNFDQGSQLMSQGKIKEGQQKLNLAKTGFEAVVKKDPNNVQSMGDLATVYYYLGEIDKAIATVKKALEINPNFTTARLNYGVYLGFGKNNTKDAIAELQKIKKDDFNYDKAQQLITEIKQASAPKSNLPAPTQSAVPSSQAAPSGQSPDVNQGIPGSEEDPGAAFPGGGSLPANHPGISISK